MKKASLYLAVFAFLVFLTWTTRLYATLAGLVALKIGAIGLALIASLDAFLTGAANKPRYLILVPILAALFLGDVMTGSIMLARGVRAFSVPSESMQPSVMRGDRIVVDSYSKNGPPQRGDIVVFLSPATPRVISVKRIIGIPGDRIHLWDGVVYRNGERVDEAYVVHNGPVRYDPYRDNFPQTPASDAFNVFPDWQHKMWTYIQGGDIVVPGEQLLCDGRQPRRQLRQPLLGFYSA